MDIPWEFLSPKVIKVTIGKRAWVTKETAGRPIFCLCTRRLVAQTRALGIVGVPQKLAQPLSAALFYTGKRQPSAPSASIFFGTHLFLLALTTSLISSHSRASAFPSHIRWDPTPSISSSLLSLLLPTQPGTCTSNELVSSTLLVRICLHIPLESGLLITVGNLQPNIIFLSSNKSAYIN